MEEAALEAGARRVVTVSEPLAAAVGAGLAVDEARGSMVVDIGGGTTEVAVFVLGGIVAGASEPVAGDAIDRAVIAFVRKEHGVLIGERTAERLKVRAAAATRGARDVVVEFAGKDLSTGRPRRIQLSSDTLAEAVAEPVARIVDTVLGVVDRLPAEIFPDLIHRGLVLTGGGALLAGLDRLLEREIGVTVKVDPEPMTCVVRGAGMLLERLRLGPARRPRRNLKSDARFDDRRRGSRGRRGG